MRKESSSTYVLLIGALLCLMSLPNGSTERMRGSAVALFSPTWEQLGWLRLMFRQQGKRASQEEMQRLQLENQLLHSEVERLQELVQHELFLKEISRDSIHSEEVQNYLNLQLQALPARVIFRSPGTWNSSVWLNVGSGDNEKFGKQVIAKNSPVMVGMSIIGVVDYVGKRQCRVRLITDSGLNPSVRVARGVNAEVVKALNECLRVIDDQELVQLLKMYKRDYLDVGSASYLAKGELCGSSEPLWRAQGQLLKGTGFNYDYPDEIGSARDLRTGLSKDAPPKRKAVPLIRLGDLLVTTGMDGVFPKGLHVAKVTAVNPLKEGDYFYDIEAVPTAGNLNEIDMVMVLPPVGFDPSDKPPYLS